MVDSGDSVSLSAQIQYALTNADTERYGVDFPLAECRKLN